MTTTTIDPTRAGQLLGEVLGDSELASNAGQYFTCSEADHMATALLALGQRDAAITWITGHSEGDDCGDVHHGISHFVIVHDVTGDCDGNCTVRWSRPDQYTRATAYVDEYLV